MAVHADVIDQLLKCGSLAGCKLNGQIEEAFTGHELITAYGRTEEVQRRFTDTNESLYQASYRAQFVSGLVMPFVTFLGNVGYVVIAVLGGLRIASGTAVRMSSSSESYPTTFSMVATSSASGPMWRRMKSSWAGSWALGGVGGMVDSSRPGDDGWKLAPPSVVGPESFAAGGAPVGFPRR